MLSDSSKRRGKLRKIGYDEYFIKRARTVSRATNERARLQAKIRGKPMERCKKKKQKKLKTINTTVCIDSMAGLSKTQNCIGASRSQNALHRILSTI
jgi:hypothetical protein